MPSDTHAEFPSTAWSVVSLARKLDDPACAEALAKLIKTYTRPAYAYLRTTVGIDQAEAQRLTTDFTSVFFFEKHLFEKVDRTKGKFKHYLLGCLRNFLGNDQDHERRSKNVGGIATINMDFAEAEAMLDDGPVDPQSAERAYARAYTATLLSNAWEGVRLGFEKRGRADQFEAIRSYLTSEQDDSTRAQLAERLKISVTEARYLIQETRDKLRALIHAALLETVDKPELADEEFRDLGNWI